MKYRFFHMAPVIRLTDSMSSGLCQQSNKLRNTAKHRCLWDQSGLSPMKQGAWGHSHVPCFFLLSPITSISWKVAWKESLPQRKKRRKKRGRRTRKGENRTSNSFGSFLPGLSRSKPRYDKGRLLSLL